MANLAFTITTPAGGVTNAADANPHTVLQAIAPANHRVLVRSFEIGFRGVVVTGTPIELAVLYQSTAGTGGTSVTPRNTNAVAETIQTTALRGAFSAEPTAGNIIWEGSCQPQLASGKAFTFSQEFVIPGGGRLGLRVTDSSSAGSVCFATFYCEE